MNFKIALICFLFSQSLLAKLNVVTTTTDLAWLVSRIGGKHVTVTPLLNGTEDPHFLDAMPHMINKVARADMFCQVGLELEIGWVPRILTRSANANVQPGGKGFCDASLTVKNKLDVRTTPVDRSLGDVHAFGNPHYHLSPKAFMEAGNTILNTLISLDTKNSQSYVKNYDELSKKMLKLSAKVAKILSPLKGKAFMEYHREFSYFLSEYKLKNIGTIESVPGVPPSAGRIARVSINAKNSKVSLALASNNSPKKLTDRFQELSGVKVLRKLVSLRYKKGKLESYFSYQINLAKSMVKSLKK